jgi:hypothetical protein
VAGLTFSFYVDGGETPISVSFAGLNPLTPANVQNQILLACVDSETDALVAYPRFNSDGFLSISAPFSVEIVDGEAANILGFSSGGSNLSITGTDIQEIIYLGERNGLIDFIYDAEGNIIQVNYYMGGGLLRYHTFVYSNDIVTRIVEGIEAL